MISPERLQELLFAYAEEAKLFFYSYGLANLVIDAPVDHVAIKALNREVYKEYIQTYLPLSKRLSYEAVGSRDIAIAELYNDLNAGTLGKVGVIEIMEPKPGKIATTHDLIDHIELLVSGLEPIRVALVNKQVEFSEQSTENHKAIVVTINEWGQEVKFSNKPLVDIANKQIAKGLATDITKTT